ncbi:hypothetical protein K1T71_006945 [Dendrolimus kikuchii]|uniref:Uncharacterized protein n=1 Tax=Dendrolimus kikuchii TaxID=765133 RepID=A0ACC1CZA6_9NEOP|nr:hypothetical protein K1T71_006945 [Dendrolimus kikuchii]
MIRLPDIQRKHKDTKDLCKCHPICKSRRREWKGKVQNTSAELLLERKPVTECFRRWPTKVYPNSPCPLFGRSKRVTINERNRPRVTHMVRVCQAPIDDTVNTPYLKYAEMAKKIGAWDAVRACCAFCECGACCPCGVRDYVLRDVEQSATRRSEMRNFDARVKHDYMNMRIMYDKV